MDACLSACEKYGYQYQIDCVNNNACGDIQARCGSVNSGGSSGGTSGGIGDAGIDLDLTECQFDCDTLFGRQCITASEQSTCRSTCASNTGAARSTFMSCQQSAAECPAAHDCYSIFTGK
jgi:hypothetical protein